MLNIHERQKCGIPVIIEGETGVGKTALLNMLSKLWNHALRKQWKIVKGRILEKLRDKSLGRYLCNTLHHNWIFFRIRGESTRCSSSISHRV